MAWIDEFMAESEEVVTDPFNLHLLCAVAALESNWGRKVIRGPLDDLVDGLVVSGFNEIGYKAVLGHPSVKVLTHDGLPGTPVSTDSFRLFRDRHEQAKAFLWLLHCSNYRRAVRLLHVLCFYSAYAPGRTDGAKELIRIMEAWSRPASPSGAKFPLSLEGLDADTLEYNHAAIRQGVKLFCEMTNIKTGVLGSLDIT